MVGADDQSIWGQALVELGAMLDLSADEKSVRMAALHTRSPQLATRVAELLAADARGTATDGDAGSDVVEPPRIAGYRIIGLLGRGGMGDVFEAERVVDGTAQQVALKCVRIGQGQSARARFLAERQILARLQHANIARLIDAGLGEDLRPWMAMELVRGRTLPQFAASNGLDIAARLRLFVVACQAVAYAHRKLVIHCDLKPGNVLVDLESQVKLLDFGISKLIAPDASASATWSMTPAYAAPEQLLGEPLSVATDVYSLGLLLLELLVGPLPARGLRERMLEATTESGDALRPSAVALRSDTGDTPGGIGTRRRLSRVLAGDLDQIVMTALRRDPGRRYRDAQALADDLDRYLAGRPVRARPDEWRYRAGKFVLRHKLAVAMAAFALIALLAATWVSLRFAAEARVALAVAQTEQRKSVADAARANQIKNFLVSTLNDIDPLDAADGKGINYTAAELLSAASERIDAAHFDSPEAQGEILNALAEGLESLGRYDQALALANRSLAVMGESPAAMVRAEGLHTRARISAHEGKMRAATEDVSHALAMLDALDRAGEKDTAGRALALHSLLASIARAQGDHKTARAESEAVLRSRIALLGSDQDPKLVVDWNNLAFLDLDLGRYQDAERGFARAIEVFGKARGMDHPRMAWLRDGRGRALLGLGDFDGAGSEFAQARAIAEAALGSEHPMMANIHSSLGNLALARADYALALSEHRRARALRNGGAKIECMDDLRIAADLLRLGQGRESLVLFEQVAQSEAALKPGAGTACMHTARVGLAAIRVSQGDAAAADDARAALAALARIRGGNDGATYRMAQSLIAPVDRREQPQQD